MAPKAVLTGHNKKQKEAARKRGPSLKNKTRKLGLKANIRTAVFYEDPTHGIWHMASHCPTGKTLPDLNALLAEYQRTKKEPRVRPGIDIEPGCRRSGSPHPTRPMRPRQQSRRTKSMQRPDGAQLAHTAPENVYDVPDDDGGRVLSESASGEASSVEYDTGGQTSDGAADAGVTDNEHEPNSAVGERSTEALLPVAKGDHVDSVEDMPSIEDSELLGDTWFINDMTEFGAGIEEMGSDDLLEVIEGMEEGTFSDMPMIDQMLQLQLVDQAGTPPQPAREESQAKGSPKPNSLADSRARRLSLARAEAEAWTYWARHTRPLLWGW
ncbi:hypothetical protein BBO_09592 [Beauveria brongniartii RCEF 3172]|uniref:Uncharacterized protein n=1 Tax=Beauveria brongniartii RCEF 3172 TaxID=1081107 RepID=A0A162IC32_9HYPO|nr:hypothetical protein BBO_09592 [Beauveria brongniartii RCEF 3172]